MEDSHVHIPVDLAQVIGYVLMVGTIAIFAIFAKIHGRDIIRELKGANNRWDAPELAIVIWLILFPIMVLADVFIGFHASEPVWYSMDAIMLFILAGKVGLEYARKPSGVSKPLNKESEIS